MPGLPVGSKVGYRNHVTNKYDVGIVSARDARSYTIYMENGLHISRNCVDLKCTDAPFELKTQPVVSTNANLSMLHPKPQLMLSVLARQISLKRG